MHTLLRKIMTSFCAVFLLAGIGLLTLNGCSDSSSNFDTSNGPFVNNVNITRVGTPTVGGGQTYLFHADIAFNDPSDPANPPMVDILSTAGQSVIGGRQKLQQVLAASGVPNLDPNGWTYQFTLTSTAIASAVNIVVYAQDTSAKKGNTPYTLANVALP